MVTTGERSRRTIDVVAIAASAGGLEAITAVLRTLRADFPAAVIVAMHLSDTGVRLGPYSAHSALPVALAQQDVPIRPGRVYFAPPGHAVELEPDGTATLVPHRNPRYPIDATLTSLAESYGPRALALILTGMRSDGAAGVREIKKRGGCVLVQSPDSSTHPSMPEAAIATGAVDLVLPLSDIGRMLDTIVTRGVLPPTGERVAALDQVFGGPGAVRELLRAIDWSQSPLGPVETWRAELRSTVRLVLGSGSPISLLWGQENVYFYNDASIGVLGAEIHPRAVGRPLAYGFPEGAEAVGALADGVRASGQPFSYRDFFLPLQTGGRLFERYFDATYEPVPTDRGIEGVLAPYVETTDMVLARRRMMTLAALAAVPVAPTRNQAFASLVNALASNPHDLPLVLAYQVEHAHQQAHLKGAAGAQASSQVAPTVNEIASPRAAWPLAQVIDTRAPMVIFDLIERFSDRVIGPWGEATSEALLLPLGGLGDSPPSGVLVVGLNRRRPLDTSYREFLDLVAAQVSAGIVSAHAFETSRQRSDALAEANRVKSEFFSNVSHEFRTPLTLILGPIERMRASGSVPDDVAADLEVVERNARRLLALVSALLDVAQADAHRLLPRLQAVDLAAETTELAGLFRAAIEHAGLRFSVDCKLTQPIPVDRTMWAKIVVNLLANALKFTFEGEICVTLRERAQHAELVVSDTGTGISAADRPHVFERFFRSADQRSRSHEGSGIGLALVKELVQAHAGRVRVQSEPGRGATFTVWIPTFLAQREIEPAAPLDATTRDNARAIATQAMTWTRRPGAPPEGVRDPDLLDNLDAVSGDTAGACILIADDNADMRAYLERLLHEAGWRVASAADGEEALARIRELHPDLVVADVMMPRVDGFELIRRVRADPDLRGLPIVLVTARANESAAVEGLVAGANDYISKPFTGRELVARLTAQIQIARACRSSERLDAFRVTLFDAIDGLEDPLEIEATACRTVGLWLGVESAVYGEFEDRGEITVIRRPYHAEGRVSAPERFSTSLFGAPFYEVMKRGQRLAVTDIDEDPQWDEQARAGWRAVDLRAALTVPVIEEGKIVTYAGVGSALPRIWSELDIAVVADAALRMREAIRRSRAEAAQRENAELHRMLIDAVDDAIALCEVVKGEGGRVVDYRFVTVNRAHEQLVGLPRSALIGRLRSEVPLAPDPEFLEMLSSVIESGKPMRKQRWSPALARRVSFAVLPQGNGRVAIAVSAPPQPKKIRR